MSGLTLCSQQVRALLWAELCPLATHMPSWFACLWKMRRAPGALLSQSCLIFANLFTVLIHSWTKEVLPWQEQTKKPPFKVRRLPTGERKSVTWARTEEKGRHVTIRPNASEYPAWLFSWVFFFFPLTPTLPVAGDGTQGFSNITRPKLCHWAI